ncbi:uncharacterized protein [Dysidea avara]|uniref:uncharacterized protein n=1 Tax=Dysidea avara TaxID=196820 RepID=UPI00332AD8A0
MARIRVDHTTTTVTKNVSKCCTFEATIKGVLFYDGYALLNPATFQQVYLIRDYQNKYHHRSYWVKLMESNTTLGHLSRETADACYYVAGIPTVMYTANTISGFVYSLDSSSKNYKDMATDILISVSAIEKYHGDILECFEQFSVTVEEYLPKWLR